MLRWIRAPVSLIDGLSSDVIAITEDPVGVSGSEPMALD
jgi:hypothetical protein